MKPWVARVSAFRPVANDDAPGEGLPLRDDFPALAPLRLRPAIEVSALDDAVWLRGPDLSEDVERELRCAAAEIFERKGEGRLFPLGRRLPIATDAPKHWTPLASWWTLERQVAALPGEPPRPVPLQIVRGGSPRPASVLVCGRERWFAHALAASTLRLARWQFASSGDGRILVRGTPLPAIPGELFVEHAGVCIPCGFTWSPSVSPTILRRLLHVLPGELILFRSDTTYERIPAIHLCQATRSMIRKLKAGGRS